MEAARIATRELRRAAWNHDFTVEVSAQCGLHPAPCALLTMRSVHARYAVTLDPVGSIAFHRGKPQSWLMVPGMVGFPEQRLTVECLICPFRAASYPTLISYRSHTRESGDRCAFALYENGRAGLTVAIMGQSCETGIRLDYSQWQRIAVTWDGRTGSLRVFQDDGQASISAALAHSTATLGEARFSATLGLGQSIPGGGCLVFGQMPERFRDPSSFLNDYSFCGSLMSMSIWNRVLSRDDLNRHTLEAIRGDEAGLVAAWRFPQSSHEQGEGWNLCSEKENVPLLSGIASRSIKDVQGLRFCAGMGTVAVASRQLVPANSCAHLAATFERSWNVVLGSREVLDLGEWRGGEMAGEFTVEVIMAAARAAASCHVIRCEGQTSWAIGLDDARRPFFSVIGEREQGQEWHAPESLPPRRVRLAVTRSRAMMQMFIDGRLTAEWNDFAMNSESDGRLIAGGRGFAGRIGKIRIWARCLSPEELGGEQAETHLLYRWQPSPGQDAGLVIAPDPAATRIQLNLNGERLDTVPIQLPILTDENPTFSIGVAEDVTVNSLRILKRPTIPQTAQLEPPGEILLEFGGGLTSVALPCEVRQL